MATAKERFRDFVLDQLRGLAGVEARRMFGGFGLRCDGTFFAILARDRLFLKTAEEDRADFQAHGMGPFRPRPRQTLSSYWEVPLEVLEDEDTLVEWARRAVRAARASAEPSTARGTRGRRRGKPAGSSSGASAAKRPRRAVTPRSGRSRSG